MLDTPLNRELQDQLRHQLADTQEQIHAQKDMVREAREALLATREECGFTEVIQQRVTDFETEKVALRGLRFTRNFLRNELGMNALGTRLGDPAKPAPYAALLSFVSTQFFHAKGRFPDSSNEAMDWLEQENRDEPFRPIRTR